MNETKKLKGRDLITIGIFSALYFILNLAAMITGFVPVLWLLLPGVAGILTGIPFMLMESKVQKPGGLKEHSRQRIGLLPYVPSHRMDETIGTARIYSVCRHTRL